MLLQCQILSDIIRNESSSMTQYDKKVCMFARSLKIGKRPQILLNIVILLFLAILSYKTFPNNLITPN